MRLVTKGVVRVLVKKIFSYGIDPKGQYKLQRQPIGFIR